MKVKVIYPAHASPERERVEFMVDLSPGASDLVPSHLAESSYDLCLEATFRLCNLVQDEDIQRFQDYCKQAGVTSLRSMMVGDLVEFPNGPTYRCDPYGWTRIIQAEPTPT